MTIDNKNNLPEMDDEEDFLLDTLEDEEEEEETPRPRYSGGGGVDYGAYPAPLEVEKLTKEVSSLKEFIQNANQEKKNARLSHVLNKYDVDDNIKLMLLDVLGLTNETISETTQALTQKLEEIYQKDERTRKDIETLNQHMSSLYNTYNFRTGVKEALEGYAKKATVKEINVKEAILTHQKKLQKDASYKYKIENIWRDPQLTPTEKQLLIQQSAVESYVEAVKNKKAKKTKAQKDLELKKTPTESAAVAAAKETHAETNEATAKVDVSGGPTKEQLEEAKKRQIERLKNRFK